jgi:hypothetical protein
MVGQSKVNQWKGLKSKPTRNGKFGAIKVAVDGIKFDSKLEAEYYGHLKKRIAAKEISDLQFHPAFPIVIGKRKICVVKLDFQYIDHLTGYIRYIDCKGMDTAISRLKRKMVQASYGIKVELWRKGDAV